MLDVLKFADNSYDGKMEFQKSFNILRLSSFFKRYTFCQDRQLLTVHSIPQCINICWNF
jgi:hypothetical protein